MWCHHSNKSHIDLEFGFSLNLWFKNISIYTSYKMLEVKKKVQLLHCSRRKKQCDIDSSFTYLNYLEYFFCDEEIFGDCTYRIVEIEKCIIMHWGVVCTHKMIRLGLFFVLQCDRQI